MNDRLFASLLFALSGLLAVAELALLFSASLPPDLPVLFLSLALSLAGMLFSARLFLGSRHAVESVSARRKRAMRDEMMRERLEGYRSDEEFRGGACGDGGKPSIERSGASGLEGFSLDMEGFREYIGRSMGEGGNDGDEDGISVELDSDALARSGGTMPSDFSHDPSSVMASLRRAGGKP
ncbi:hypothetical protein [Chlorobium sp. N1]|uniref:hypothetical protein n=1 Tax=Chlorobium sp. N1 TaxID=2491138 RepID=UPI00103F73EA|nr:hypothetical protein [Chlorobium sp. N1]TCD47872.1 hypothetical protein E0L29_06220 [Chlorobium sp. N1]